jgi:hypothetical protein
MIEKRSHKRERTLNWQIKNFLFISISLRDQGKLKNCFLIQKMNFYRQNMIKYQDVFCRDEREVEVNVTKSWR